MEKYITLCLSKVVLLHTRSSMQQCAIAHAGCSVGSAATAHFARTRHGGQLRMNTRSIPCDSVRGVTGPWSPRTSTQRNESMLPSITYFANSLSDAPRPLAGAGSGAMQIDAASAAIGPAALVGGRRRSSRGAAPENAIARLEGRATALLRSRRDRERPRSRPAVENVY